MTGKICSVLLLATLVAAVGLAQTTQPTSKKQVLQSAFSDGSSTQLNQEQIGKLLALKVPIAVPTYIPQGFTLNNVTASRENEIVDYTLEYANPAGGSFTVQSANDGIGSVDLSKIRRGRNPYFKGELLVGHPDGETGNSHAEWVENNPRHSGSRAQQFYSVTGEGVLPIETMKIMRSLRYLKR